MRHGYAVVAVAAVLLAAGTAAYAVFEGVNPWDGFLWSLDTIATEGARNKPESVAGEITWVLLIVLGVGTLLYALVTAVEVLSRSNKKPGDGGRTAYLQKQYEYRAAGVNVVELDLLRGGLPTTAFPADRRPPAGTFDYHVSVLVPGAAPYCFLAPIRLTDRLPTLPVPLDPDVPPVPVDLQGVFDRCYDGGRYPELVRYDRDPEPPLTPEQKAWADALLRAKGLLSGGPT